MANPNPTRITEDYLKKITGEYDLEVMQWLELRDTGIRRIENLSGCTSIRTLSLCGNQIRDICGLEGLISLERLDLSSNRIQRIENLGHLTSLQSLDLKDNQISNVDDVGSLSPLPNLRRLLLQSYHGDKTNPACQHPSYHTVVTRLLPKLDVLDGESLNLRKCMVDVVLDRATPDDEALKSPERQRWCEGFDWTPQLVSGDVEEDIRVEMDTLLDTLQECERLNRRAKDALQAM
eukprot:g14106.t1